MAATTARIATEIRWRDLELLPGHFTYYIIILFYFPQLSDIKICAEMHYFTISQIDSFHDMLFIPFAVCVGSFLLLPVEQQVLDCSSR